MALVDPWVEKRMSVLSALSAEQAATAADRPWLMGQQGTTVRPEPMAAMEMTDPAELGEGGEMGEADGEGMEACSLPALLVRCAAFAKELETQSHLIHLNYEGQNFLPIHQFLKDQYEAHLEQFDALAEIVRMMDFLLPMCGCGLKDQACGFENVTEYDGRHMLMVYLRNLQAMASMGKRLEETADEADAPDVQDYAAALVGASNKAAWFLKATLRGC